MQRGLESRLSVDWQHRRPRHFSRMGRKSALLAKIPGHYVRPLTAAAVIPTTDRPSHVFVHNPAPQDSGSPPTPREPAFSIFSSWCALRPTPHVDRLSNCAIVGRIGVQSPRLYRDPTHMTTSLSQFSSRSHSRVAYGSTVARTGTGAFRLPQRLFGIKLVYLRLKLWKSENRKLLVGTMRSAGLSAEIIRSEDH